MTDHQDFFPVYMEDIILDSESGEVNIATTIRP